MHRHHAPIHMQLSYNGAASFQLWAEGVRRAFAQSQQTDENVLLWVLVRQEGFPATIGHIVASDQLHLQIRVHILQPLSHVGSAYVEWENAAHGRALTVTLYQLNLETTAQNTVQPQSHVRSVQPGNNRTEHCTATVMSDLFNLETTEQNTVQLQSHVRSVQPGNNRTEHRTATKSCQICSTWKLWHRTAYSYPVLCHQLHMQITVQNNLQLRAGCISLLFGERTTEQTPDLTWR